MTLGERIYQLRSAKGLSQGHLADMLEVSRQSISKWENDAAIPELDKLMKLSEIFDITLDELVKGEKSYTSEPKPVTQINQTQKIVGIIIFAFVGLLFLFGLFFNVLLLSLFVSIPFIICGILCFTCKHNTGLWCSWILYVFITSYLLWATGTTWSSIFFYVTYSPNFNMQMIVSVILLLVLILLIGITVLRFSKITIEYKKLKKQLCITILIYFALIVIEYLFNTSSFYQSILNNLMTRAWLLTLINTLFDWLRVLLFIFVLINLVRFIQYKRSK